jgi:hypothetical protein
MSKFLLVVALIPLACAAADPPQVTITAQRDAEWASYRHAYKAAASFDFHTRTRPLIQAHMQLRPREPGVRLEGIRVQLASESMTLDVPVDGIGRSTLPMLKKAYDEDAVLRLNRQKGYYRFSGRYSIKERDDGVYSMAQLREACEQVLSAQRASGSRFRLMGKNCAGVRFIYPLADSSAALAYRSANGAASSIAATDAEPFESGALGWYKVAIVRFAAWPAQGEVIAAARPLAIGTVYE